MLANRLKGAAHARLTHAAGNSVGAAKKETGTLARQEGELERGSVAGLEKTLHPLANQPRLGSCAARAQWAICSVIVSILAVILMPASAAYAEARYVTLQVNTLSLYGNIVPTATVAIASNEVATVVSAGGGYTGVWSRNGISFGISGGLVVAGPAQLSITANPDNNQWGWLTVKIEPGNFPPGQTVIIPQGSGALISLEASTDLRTWTNSVPGVYTNVPANQFFRIRADRLP